MLNHTLIIIYRSFKRYKGSFLINVLGLTAGLAGMLLIYLWVSDELSIDKFKNSDTLYQVLRNEPDNGVIRTEEANPGPLAEALAMQMPEIEHAASVVTPASIYKGVLSVENSNIKVSPQFADKSYFNLFPCKFLQGDKTKVLLDMASISISEDIALRLFHTTENVIGKTVSFKNEYFDGLYTIAGVFNLPSNASNRFDVLFNYDLFISKRPEVKEWANGGPKTFLTLRDGTDVNGFNEKISHFLKDKRKDTQEILIVQKYSERYLNDKFENGVAVDGRITYIRLFSIIAVFILLIACINFVNLSTAKASRRIKEIGIKKAVGAARKTLIAQYLSESFLIVCISLLAALLVVVLLLPHFNELTGKSLSLNFHPALLLSLFFIAIITTLLAGSYPALYLSGFNPIGILKGTLKTSVSELLVRKGLVIFQFIISIILIVSVLVIYKQMQYLGDKNLGYDKENIISLSREGGVEKHYPEFIERLKNIPGVENASYLYGDLTGGVSSRSGGLSWKGQTPEAENTRFNYLDVDYNLIETLGLRMQAGRTFSKEFGADSMTIIFNEAAIETMGIKDPVGKTVDFYGNRKIIGVVKNFHFESLHEGMKPFFFKMDNESGGSILVKIKKGAERATIKGVQNLYREFNPDYPFEYTFLDEDYEKLYTSEATVASLSKYFAGLAVLISCLGLFGLAAFTAERRKKEIGIRKVLGASGFNIINMLSTDFNKLVITAIIIAVPISYLLTQNWLNAFAFKIELSPWYFIIAAVLALGLAWLTVGFQAIKASLANPVKSLRAE
ncbi:MAG TPA: FtsX-like permease family protein [Pedobacter sp.]|jgi:ABC-type antimicrobial peptide transport system permease subunit